MAMHGGYLQCLKQATGKAHADLLCLYYIEHTNLWDGVAARIETPGLSERCQAERCGRCLLGKGGYEFRWYDRRWDKSYRENARVGAWMPGEDPDYDPPQKPLDEERVVGELNRWLLESQAML